GAFTIFLHEFPDLDAVAASYLATACLGDEGFPAGAEALVRYADRVVQGAVGMSRANPFSFYSAYQRLANRPSAESGPRRWEACVRDGLRLVEDVLGRTATGTPLPHVDAFACPGRL